jgi:capsular polysaccharide transport system permease protein
VSTLLHSSFFDSLKCQSRVVGALILREMRARFGRSQLGYLWAIVEPLAYVAAFSAVFHFADRHPPFGSSMVLFFAAGVLPFHLFRHVANQLAGAFKANRALLTYPVVQPIDTIISRSILEIATSIFVIILVFSILVAAGEAPLPNNVLRLCESISLLALLGFGYGLSSAVLITHIDSWQNISRLIMTPTMFLSGVLYPLDSLPKVARDIIAWNPIVHGVELFRDGYYSNYRSNYLDVGYLAVVGLFLTFIALAMERTIRGRIE